MLTTSELNPCDDGCELYNSADGDSWVQNPQVYVFAISINACQTMRDLTYRCLLCDRRMPDGAALWSLGRGLHETMTEGSASVDAFDDR